MEIKPGDILNSRYRVTQLLAPGGQGCTWLVNDTSENNTQKVIKLLTNNSPKAVELFKREVKVLQELNHPGIPKVAPDGDFTLNAPDGDFTPNAPDGDFTPNAPDGDFTPNIEGERRPSHFLVMEYIEGENLEQWLKSQPNNSINSEQAIDWLKQLVEILDLVHERGYFHRDIKPKNIMRKPNGQLVLIDFGGVKEITNLENTGTGLISVGYTPPEQLEGKAVPQSDFFALGRTLVYLLTGQAPTEFEYPLESNNNWRNKAPNIPNFFANLIDELMANSPQERPENTQIILQRLALISIQSAIDPIIDNLTIIGAKNKAREILKETYQKWLENTKIPIIGLYGRTNSGKSSLINAIMGQEVAKVGTGVSPTTAEYESYLCSQNGWKRKFVDSRGVGEKYTKKSYEEAFKEAINKIVNEKIDILLFVVLAVEVGYSEYDFEFLKALQQAHKKAHNTELPILLVINKIDQVPDPEEWSPPYDLGLTSSTDNHTDLEHKEKESYIKDCIRARLKQYEKLTQEYVAVCTYCNWARKRSRIYNIKELEEKMQNLISDELVKYSFNQSSSFSKLRRDVAYNFCEAAARLSWFIMIFSGNFQNFQKFQKDLVILIKSLADQEEGTSLISVEEFWHHLSRKQEADNNILAVAKNNISATARTFQIGNDAIRCFFDKEELEKVKDESIKETPKIESDLQEAFEQGGEDEVMRRLKQKYKEMQERYALRGNPRMQEGSQE